MDVSSAPSSWRVTTLGSVVELTYGKSLPAKVRDGISFPVFGSNGEVGKHSSPLVEAPGLIIGRKGSFGEVHISEKPFFPIDTTYYVDNFRGQPIRYWFYQLRFLPLNQLNRATAIPGLNREDAYSQKIALPPLAEQKVIADKLDTLLAQVENTQARLERIPQILKRFRQSVLAAAVSGRLTREFRESAISAAMNDLDKDASFRTIPKKKVEPTSAHEVVLDLFPSDWTWSTFSDLYQFIDYRGKSPKKSTAGKRLYTAKNIKMGYLTDQPIEYLQNEDFESWMTRGFSKEGDIFFVTEGHTMGCCALNTLGSDIALAQRTITLQPFGRVNTKFHLFYMLTSSFQRLVELNATGSAARGIKSAKLKGLPVPFPTYAEQTEIARRVDQLFAHADRIEQQVSNALVRVNNLTQSILAKAFRGELTEKWRKDNPELISGENSAEALLERIKSERAAQKPAGRQSKKKKSELPAT